MLGHSKLLNALKNTLKLFLKVFIYLLIFRERGREGEGGRETLMCGCLSHAISWGPVSKPRHVP